MTNDATIDELKVLITAQTKKFEQQMKEVSKRIEGLDKSAGKSLDSLGDRFKSLGNRVAQSAKAITASVAAIGAAMAGVTESTREFREDLARLQTTAATTGNSMKSVQEQFSRIYEITGEVDSSVEAMNNLMTAGFKGGTLERIVDELNGAAIAFSDTLKIEGLADGLQETLATGKSIGPFDELLSRLGVNLDQFNAGLQEAIKNGTAHNYVLNTLAGSGLSNVNDAYRQMNAELIKGRQVRLELQTAFADLGKAVEPIVNAVIPYITKFIQLITKAINYTVLFVKTLFGKNAANNVVDSQNKAIERMNQATAAVSKNTATGANKTGEMGKNLSTAGKEAKKLQSTLAGFDEINMLNFFGSQSDALSDADIGSTPVGIDIAPFEMPDISPFEEQIAKIPDKWLEAMERIRATLSNMFTPWVDAFKKYSPDILGSFKELGKGIAGVFSALGNSLEGIFAHVGYKQFVDGFVGFTANAFGLLVDALNGTVLPMLQGFFKAFDPDINPYMDKFMFTLGEAAQKSKESAAAIRTAFEPIFEMLAPKFHDLGFAIGTVFVSTLDLAVHAWGTFMDALNPQKNPVMKSFINVFGIAAAALSDMATAIAKHIAPIFKKLKPVVDRVVTSLTNLYLIIGESVLKVLTTLFDKLNPDKNPAMALLIDRIGSLIEKILELWAIVAEKLSPIIEKLTPIFMKIAGVISNIFIDVLDSAVEAMSGLIDIISGFMTGDWKQIWDGALDIVKNFWVLFLLPAGAAVKGLKIALFPITALFSTAAKLASNAWKAGLKLTQPVRDNIEKIKKLFNKIKGVETNTSNKKDISEKQYSNEETVDLSNVVTQAEVAGKNASMAFAKAFQIATTVKNEVLKAKAEFDKFIAHAGTVGRSASVAFGKSFTMSNVVRNEVLKSQVELNKMNTYVGMASKNASSSLSRNFKAADVVRTEMTKVQTEVSKLSSHASAVGRNASKSFSSAFTIANGTKTAVSKAGNELAKIAPTAKNAGAKGASGFASKFVLKNAVGTAAKVGLRVLGTVFGGGIGNIAVEAGIYFGKKFKIVDKVKEAVNKCKPYFDKIKNWWNDTKESISNWFSGGSSGKKTSTKAPKMARGGIISSAQHFIAGESGREVIMPLENNTQWLDIVANKIMQGMQVAMPQQSGNQQAIINLYLDKELIGKATVDFINKKSKIEGRSVLKSQLV